MTDRACRRLDRPGELDAWIAGGLPVELARHADGCPACAERAAEIERLRRGFAELAAATEGLAESPSADVAAAVMRRIEAPAPRRRWLWAAPALVAAALMAAVWWRGGDSAPGLTVAAPDGAVLIEAAGRRAVRGDAIALEPPVTVRTAAGQIASLRLPGGRIDVWEESAVRLGKAGAVHLESGGVSIAGDLAIDAGHGTVTGRGRFAVERSDAPRGEPMRLLRKHKVLAAAVLAVAAYGGWATLNAVRSDASIEAPGGALLGPAGEIARFGVEGDGGGGPLAALRGESASAAPGGDPVEGAAASISGAYWDEDRQLVVFRLAGEVLDAATGEPVERFRIRARALESKGYGQRRERSWSFAERGDGRFELGGLGLGTWRLEVSAPGYSPKALTVPLTGLDADPYLVVPMTEGTELTGRVVDWRGRPVSEARVGLTECFGRAPSDDCPSVESAADGSFALPRLPEDQVFSIRAEHPRYGFATERNLVQTAGAGEHVVIELSGIARIFGEVSRGAAREPVAGAVVVSGEARTESDANGFYELRVPLEDRPEAFVETLAGRNIGRAASYPESRSAWPLTWVDAETHVAEVRIDFRLAMESATLFGRVTDGAGRPVAGAELELRNTAGWKRGRGHETFPTRATTDSDGRYRIENVPAQAGYRVLLVDRDGGEPTQLGYVNVREEAPVEANFRIASGAIRGRFVSADSGEPLALSARGCDRLGARAPGSDTWSLPHCYPDGRFEIGGLAPGRYRLESRLPWMDSPVEIEPTAARVAAGAIVDGVEVAVRGEPSVTWRFRILDERGKFLLGAFVRYLVGESAMFTSNLHVGDDGTAQMSLDGSVTDIAIDRAGYRSVDLDLEGRDPEEVIEVRLEKL